MCTQVHTDIALSVLFVQVETSLTSPPTGMLGVILCEERDRLARMYDDVIDERDKLSSQVRCQALLVY